MKKRPDQSHLLNLSLLTLTIILLAACAPANPAPVATAVVPVLVDTPVSSQVPQGLPTESAGTATEPPAPVLVATSRGPNLEATDPATVSLASGQVQLVEFFRFT